MPPVEDHYINLKEPNKKMQQRDIANMPTKETKLNHRKKYPMNQKIDEKEKENKELNR